MEVNMKDKYAETFGRVDGEEVVDEITTFEYEDNYSNRSIVAVVKMSTGKFGYGTQYLTDDPDPEAEWPKFHIKENNFDSEEEAIEAAEKYFDENYR
jgi:hypothetical protein